METQKLICQFLSSGMWRHVLLWRVTDVSEEPAAFLYPNGRGNATPATTMRQNAQEHCDNFRSHIQYAFSVRVRLKCDGTRAETRFRLSAQGRVPLNRHGRQFSQLLAAEVCASVVVMLDTRSSEVV
jgi:hypothetical protein